nr:carboxypeptidase-like regulatory domain-containing protein [Pyrinomonadaceae bacterium]
SAFTYQVGTANGYSPVTANVISGAGTLTINAVQGAHPNVPIPASSIARYWTLNGSGISTNLTFNYLQSDVTGNENLFNLIKINAPIVSGVFGPGLATFDRTLNTATINNVSSFSDWTLGEAAPTAAGASIKGRVLSATGRGISQANLILTNSNGETTIVRTNNFGYYNFADLPSGQSYTLAVNKKGYSFSEPSRVISLQESLEGVNFTALP